MTGRIDSPCYCLDKPNDAGSSMQPELLEASRYVSLPDIYNVKVAYGSVVLKAIPVKPIGVGVCGWRFVRRSHLFFSNKFSQPNGMPIPAGSGF